MKQFTLELLFQLFGISAASGLVYTDPEVHLIADNSQYFYHYNIDTQQVSKTALTQDGLVMENITKNGKPDFEAITQDELNYYIVGSGSTPNRQQLVEINKATNEVVSTQELDILYNSMKSFANLKNEDFNIEGLILDGNKWYFFNRGNGPKQANGIFMVEGENIVDDFRLTYTPIKLPKINKVQSSFTDAIKVDNKIYFLATAEDTHSTFDDGTIKGSLIGQINIKDLRLDKTQIISTTHKFEGLALYHKTTSMIRFLLCEDADDDAKPSNLYKLSFKR